MNYEGIYENLKYALLDVNRYNQNLDCYGNMVQGENNISVLDLIQILDKFERKDDRLKVCIMTLLYNPTIREIATFTITDLDNELLKQEQFYVHYKMYYVACYLKILEGEGEL